MTSREITELFTRFYGERMTWEGHLALVSHLETWSVEQLLGFQDALLEHFVEGRWVGTVPNLRIDIPGGGAQGAEYRDRHGEKQHQEAFLDRMRAEAEDDAARAEIEKFADRLRYVEAWRPDPELRYEVPHDCIGIPITDWLYEGPRERVPEEERPRMRRSLKREAAEDYSGSRVQLCWILRAAPWACFRKTGRRLDGYPPLAFEEQEASGGALTWYSIAMPLRAREGGSALVISVMSSHTEDLALHDARTNLRPVARRAGARLLVRPIEIRRGGGSETRTWRLGDGQLVWEGPALGHSLPREGVVRALDSVVGGDDPTVGYEQPLDDDVFWRLIASLPEGLRDDDVGPLITALSRLGVKRIRAFSETLARKLAELDQPELVEESQRLSRIPMSDDVFLYARCAVVASGRDAFERVLADGRLDESEWPVESGELLLMAAAEAYTAKTGEEYDHETAVSYESGGRSASRLRSGSSAATTVRSRRERGTESIDTIIQWQTDDPAEARARHLAEVARWYPETSRLIDDVRIDFDRVPPSIAVSGIAFYCTADF